VYEDYYPEDDCCKECGKPAIRIVEDVYLLDIIYMVETIKQTKPSNKGKSVYKGGVK